MPTEAQVAEARKFVINRVSELSRGISPFGLPAPNGRGLLRSSDSRVTDVIRVGAGVWNGIDEKWEPAGLDLPERERTSLRSDLNGWLKQRPHARLLHADEVSAEGTLGDLAIYLADSVAFLNNPDAATEAQLGEARRFVVDRLLVISPRLWPPSTIVPGRTLLRGSNRAAADAVYLGVDLLDDLERKERPTGMGLKEVQLTAFRNDINGWLKQRPHSKLLRAEEVIRETTVGVLVKYVASSLAPRNDINSPTEAQVAEAQQVVCKVVTRVFPYKATIDGNEVLGRIDGRRGLELRPADVSRVRNELNAWLRERPYWRLVDADKLKHRPHWKLLHAEEVSAETSVDAVANYVARSLL